MLIMQELLDLRSWVALLKITQELEPANASVREILSLPAAAKGPAFDVALDLSQLHFRPLGECSPWEACAKGHMDHKCLGAEFMGVAGDGTKDASSACAWVPFSTLMCLPVWVLSVLTYLFCCLMPVDWVDCSRSCTSGPPRNR